MIPRLLLALVAAVLPACLSAQSITIIGNRNMRPTAVLGPHVRYLVAADTDGALVLGELSVPPVAFAGTVRIEGASPGARGPERQAFADTARFEADGRVSLLLADATGRPPMQVEVTGARGLPAGRIAITAQRWPLGRIMLITLSPADLHDLVGRDAGFGVRDRIRVDDRAGYAYLTDSTTGPITVAVGLGRATRGRVQTDVSSLVVSRDFGGQQGQDRRTLGALSLVIEPSRDDDGNARAEILFGVGNSEAEALRAARSASDEPMVTPRAPALRWDTPSGDVDLLLKHILAASGWMLDWGPLLFERTIPSSAARPVLRAEDAWQGSPLALQRGDTAAVCGSFRILRGTSAQPVRVEIAPRLVARGFNVVPVDSTTPEADASLALLAHACYAATKDTAMLRASFPSIVAAARRAASGSAGALGAEAMERAAELDDELTRISGANRPSVADSLRAEAARGAGRGAVPAPAALWRSLVAEAQRGVGREYGRLSAGGQTGGLSFRAAGELVSAVVGEMFGVTEYLDRLALAPRLGGIADAHAWRLDGWLLAAGDTLGMTYRPADRAAEVRLSGGVRHRIELGFEWLTAGSCIMAQRGPDRERLVQVARSDGSFYVDVRGAFDTAVLRLSAAPCAGP